MVDFTLASRHCCGNGDYIVALDTARGRLVAAAQSRKARDGCLLWDGSEIAMGNSSNKYCIYIYNFCGRHLFWTDGKCNSKRSPFWDDLSWFRWKLCSALWLQATWGFHSPQNWSVTGEDSIMQNFSVFLAWFPNPQKKDSERISQPFLVAIARVSGTYPNNLKLGMDDYWVYLIPDFCRGWSHNLIMMTID